MKNFSYHNPTRFEFGKVKEENIGEYISESGVSKVLIVYGSERIKHSGLFNKVAQSLTDKGIHFEELGGVQSNPLLSKVYEGIEIAKAKSWKRYWLWAVVRFSIRRKLLLLVLLTRVMYGTSLLIKPCPKRH